MFWEQTAKPTGIQNLSYTLTQEEYILGISRHTVSVQPFVIYWLFSISLQYSFNQSDSVFLVWFAFTLSVPRIKSVCLWTRMQLAESHSLINAGISLAVTHEQTCFSFEEIGKECQIRPELQIVGWCYVRGKYLLFPMQLYQKPPWSHLTKVSSQSRRAYLSPHPSSHPSVSGEQ